MNKKVLFISANNFTDPYPVYPLGIAYLKGYLKQELPLFSFDSFDVNLNDLESLEKDIKANSYSYICVSMRNIDDTNIYKKNSLINWYKEIVDLCKSHSTAKIIIGGAGFSIYPKDLFRYIQPDFGIKGEGETSLLNLINALETNSDYRDIDGLVYNEENNVQLNRRCNYLKSLKLDLDDSLVDFYWQKSGMLNIQTKRGCPYNCIYCSYPLIEGKNVRLLDIDCVIESLEKIYRDKNINYVFFTDSVFNLNEAYNIELVEKIKERGINIKWGAYFSPNNLSEKALVKYRDAGLTHVEFGSDSFSNTQLANYGKSFSFEDIMEKSELCNKHRIFFAHFLILGAYGENQKTLQETFENSKKIQNSIFFPYVGMRIYPNTKLQEYAIRDGIIDKNDDLLEPKYYIADGIDIEDIKKQALDTGMKWIFPDNEKNAMVDILRQRNRKGPLWEYLRY